MLEEPKPITDELLRHSDHPSLKIECYYKESAQNCQAQHRRSSIHCYFGAFSL